MSKSITAAASVTDGTNGIEWALSVAWDTSGDHEQSVVQTIGDSEETISIHADILAGNDPGWLIAKNEDDLHTIRLGVATGAYFAELLPGEFCLVPLLIAATALYAVCTAATETAALRFKLLER